jgi:dTDP-4-amino-4,6-dideoxygalactose transaminase
VATGYGRGALLLALEAIGVRGADVVVPNFICAQVPEAVRRAGGRVVFYPVRRDLTIHAEEFHRALTPQTRAAIVAHYFGTPHRNIEALGEACRRRGIVLIEDCALTLGAPSGSVGDLAVFSFTKSDWCYGGGMVTTGVRDWVMRLRRLREELFKPAERLARYYGWLRRADFAANRPAWARLAEIAGRRLQEFLAKREPALRDSNFYDAARFDAAMPEFAARRALKILRDLRAATEQRRGLVKRMAAALASDELRIAEGCGGPDDNAAFVPLLLANERKQAAEQWVTRAACAGATLRRCWPAYQELEKGQGSDEVRWLAEQLLLLEISAELTLREVQKISRVLQDV